MKIVKKEVYGQVKLHRGDLVHGQIWRKINRQVSGQVWWKIWMHFDRQVNRQIGEQAYEQIVKNIGGQVNKVIIENKNSKPDPILLSLFTLSVTALIFSFALLFKDPAIAKFFFLSACLPVSLVYLTFRTLTKSPSNKHN